MVKRIREIFNSATDAATRLKIRVESRLGVLDELVVEPFLSWGTTEVLHVQGRVLEAKGIRQPQGDDSLPRGIRNTVSRLDSDEIPAAVVELHGETGPVRITADDEGFFRCDLTSGAPFAPGWHNIDVELAESIAGTSDASATARILVPEPKSQYVVVSDLDDTVVVTGATDKLRMIRLVATKSARERRVFPGVGGLYRAFHAGRDGYPENPIFYVTRSIWNLADLFEQILDEHHLPPGPILMRDSAPMEPTSDTFQDRKTKFDWFEALFSELPHRFVLVGDSGQHDSENFLRCARRWPGRVAAVFIRDVTPPGRDREVQAIADEIRELGIDTAVSDSSLDFARQAVRFGLIEPTAIGAVQRDIERDLEQA